MLHAKALHGNPYDGHTLGPVITDLEKLTGVAVRRIHGDKGYRGHNYPDRFRVWISGQVPRVTKVIRREMRRRAAVEPVIGHLKDDHRMRRNYLKGRHGDRINAVLAQALPVRSRERPGAARKDRSDHARSTTSAHAKVV